MLGKYSSAVLAYVLMYESAGMKLREESSTGKLISPYNPKANRQEKKRQVIIFPGVLRIAGA